LSKGERKLAFYIGVDSGGTFTDCAVMNEEGTLFTGKAPSTPPDFATGILDSLKITAESIGIKLEDLLKQTVLFVHGTTVATNTVLTHSGAKVGLITTRGFEDTILIMRALGRYAGLSEEEIKHVTRSYKPERIVPKALIKGVVERIDYRGEVIVPLDRENVREALKYLVDGKGIEAIGVSLLWSFINPTHEQEIKKLISAMYPDLYVTISSELAPKLGEYERTSTVVINCYVGPTTHAYLTSLSKQLKDYGFKYSPLVMQAYGGCLEAEDAAKNAVSTIYSGPAAGLVGSIFMGKLCGYDNIITTDVGGTSFDVGLIMGGIAERATAPIVGQYSLVMPMLEIASLGTGGGSIAWVEPVTKTLKVGPGSAGATPGPACYDMGGTEPTVTDCDLILGYINPDYFLGGRMKLNKEKAIEAVKSKIADPLGMSVTEAAAGVFAITNAHMSDLIQKMTIGKGYDPRKCVMFAYGGAGPVHAHGYGRAAKLIFVPSTAAIYSAVGALMADIVRTCELGDPAFAPVNIDRVNRNFANLEGVVLKKLRAAGFKEGEITVKRNIDLRYGRQVNEVHTPVPLGVLGTNDLERVYDEFERLYEQLYGQGAAYREGGIQLVTYGVEARAAMIKPVLARHKVKTPNPSGALKAKRDVFFSEYKDFVSTNVYDNERLQAGNVISGPAVIETPITSIVIAPDQTGKVDEYLNVIITSKKE
jgi:N-methylhydantoinase A